MKLFIELHSWFCMLPSIDKLLRKGVQIIALALLLIGQMSEEGQEMCRKYIKRFRQDFWNKTSHSWAMQYVFFRV